MTTPESHPIRQLDRFSARQRLPHPDRPSESRATGPGSRPCRPHFDVFDDFTPKFPHVEAMGKFPFFQRAPRANRLLGLPQTEQGRVPATSSRRCAHFSPLLVTVWPRRVSNQPAAPKKQTDTQKHRQRHKSQIV